MPDPAVIAGLRARIWALERSATSTAAVVPVAEVIDAALPWGGLPLACLHEVIAEDAAATGFLAVLLGRLAAAPVLWCLPRGTVQMLYPPGLAGFGLTDARLMLVRGGPKELLWAAEEGLRCPHLAAVVVEGADIDQTAGRRLQLAAESGGVVGFALRDAQTRRAAGTATTRWRVTSAASAPTPWQGIGAPRWHLSLERCRGGVPSRWLVEWRSELQQLMVDPT